MDLFRTMVSKLRLANRIRFANMFCAALLAEWHWLK